MLALIGVTVLTAAPKRLSAQTTARISGRVVDRAANEAVAAAQIVLRHLTESEVVVQLLSAADGGFARSLPVGRYAIEVSRIGYVTSTDTLELRGGAEHEVIVALQASPLAVDSVQARGEARRAYLGGFWERREKNIGYYFTREEIEQKRPYRVTDIFRSIPGVRLMRLANGPGQLVAFGRVRQINGNLCPAAVYLDGRPFATGQLGMDDFPLDQIEAIEAYSGSSRLPTQFNITGTPAGDPRCGVIVLWTRGMR